MNRSPHLKVAKEYWKAHLLPGDTAIDATCGNGHDTLFLAELGLSALFALDIQPAAIEKTRRCLEGRLDAEALKRVFLHLGSHEDLGKLLLPLPPRLIVYNLGYLPGGDKAVTTTTESTLKSVSSALSILGEKGALSITCYPGHAEGEKEEAALFSWASGLSNDWEVHAHRWINRPRSPSLIWISPHP
jgi:SAM-dependent methyltransferase